MNSPNFKTKIEKTRLNTFWQVLNPELTTDHVHCKSLGNIFSYYSVHFSQGGEEFPTPWCTGAKKLPVVGIELGTSFSSGPIGCLSCLFMKKWVQDFVYAFWNTWPFQPNREICLLHEQIQRQQTPTLTKFRLFTNTCLNCPVENTTACRHHK